MKILVDGDIIAYRISFHCKDMVDEDEVKLTVRDFFDNLYSYIDPFNMFDKLVFLTGSGNFRHDIAKTAPYKGNRKDTPKPTWLKFVRGYIDYLYNAVITDGYEADDLISIAAYKAGYDKVVIVSTDKDFNQIPVTIYNLSKGEFFTITPQEALKNFYKQILTGDTVDNIFGIYGIGPKKADKILEGKITEADMYVAVVEAYEELDKQSGFSAQERVLENGKLLYLCRKLGETWEPPL